MTLLYLRKRFTYFAKTNWSSWLKPLLNFCLKESGGDRAEEGVQSTNVRITSDGNICDFSAAREGQQ